MHITKCDKCLEEISNEDLRKVLIDTSVSNSPREFELCIACATGVLNYLINYNFKAKAEKA